METLHAIIEGNTTQFLEPVHLEGKYDVTVIINKPIVDDKEMRRLQLLELSGSCTDEVVEILKEMEAERVHFFKGRNGDDFS